MRTEDLLDAIGEAEDELLVRSEKAAYKKKAVWIKWVPLAACACLILIIGLKELVGGMGAVSMDCDDSANMEMMSENVQSYGEAQSKNVWSAELMEPAQSETIAEGVKATVIERTENEIQVLFENNGSSVWTFGYNFGVEVLLDDVWYCVPAQEDIYFEEVSVELAAGESVQKIIDLEPYGTLPTGNYRIRYSNLEVVYIEFEVTD